MKPTLLAVIREAECIGCAKCIQACPFDAILGSAKHMHTVIADECIGCKLCVAPCPVDCIDMITVDADFSKQERLERALLAKSRYREREKRLQEKALPSSNAVVFDKKKYIEAAILRAKAKK